MIDLSIEARGFTPNATTIVLRTAATCPLMGYRPDARILVAIGILVVSHTQAAGYTFEAETRHLQEDETSADLLCWLEEHLPRTGAIMSWGGFGPTPWRLSALADRDLHPRLLAAAQDTEGRWRDLPPSLTWHLRQARASSVPCICAAEIRSVRCIQVPPLALLPAEDVTAAQMKAEAIAGWQAWARLFGDFDDHTHPAVQALRAFDAWKAKPAAI